MRLPGIPVALAITALLVACGPTPEAPVDAHVERDAATPFDGGDPRPDGGLDAGSSDASVSDAGAADAGIEADAGIATGHVRGRVLEALTLDTVAIAGAVVSDGHGVTATTDADGAFDLTGLRVGTRVSLHVEPPDGDPVYASTELLVDVPATGDVRADARLLRGCATVLDLAGGERSRPLSPCGSRGARVGVELPAGGVVTASGAPVARVRMEIAAMPSLAGGELAAEAFLAFPGDMSAVDASGADVWLESRGAAEVRLYDDATGAPAQLAPGAEATLVLPAAPSSVEDEAVRVWSYDVAARAWVEEGSGTIDLDPASGTLVTRMRVPHFSWWNSDQPARRTCLTGRLETTGGVPVESASMVSLGVDYLGAAPGRIAADGSFEVFARSASTADLVVQFQLGATTGSYPTARVSTGAPDVCTDVGTVVVDTTRLLGCARGVVEDALGAPVAGADVTATQRGRAVAARSGSDGTFCLPLIGGLPTIVHAEATDASGAPLRGAVHEVVASPGGSCGGASCAELGSVVVRAPSCVTGTFADVGGPIAGATVAFFGGTTVAVARTGADGSYCAPVPAGDRYRTFGISPIVDGALVADVQQVTVAADAASCGAPSTCVQVDLTAGALTCVRGVALDAAGAPIAGATVRARPVGSTRFARAETAADGSFCVAARTGELATVEIVRETRTHRDYIAQTIPVASAAGRCGGTGCTEMGELRLRSEAFATCIRGRLLDGGAPARLPIEAHTIDQVAIVRTREDGRFCLDVDPGAAGSVTLRDPNEPPAPGCVGFRETSVLAPPAAAASCVDESACVDVGDVDFDDFCMGS